MNMDVIRKRLGDPNSVWNRLRYDCDGVIEASAGTGKTYSLQSIVLKLLAEPTADGRPLVDRAQNILLVTYTEKAAGELKDRIRSILDEADALPPDFDEMSICTIHSFCRELLSEYAFENRVPMQCEIGADIRDGLAQRAVRETLLSLEFKGKHGSRYADEMRDSEVEMTSDLESRAVKLLLNVDLATHPGIVLEEDRDSEPSDLVWDLTKGAWPRYRQLMDDAMVFSFDDLILQAESVVLAEGRKEDAGHPSAFLDSVRRRYRIALVDEFQDTNQHQWNIFSRLFSSRYNRFREKNVPRPLQGFVLVVGDPKQSIFSFQHADVGTYLAARGQITGGGGQKKQQLNATYRSSRDMIKVFNTCFNQGSGWFDGMSGDPNGAAGSIDYEAVEFPEDNAKFKDYEDRTQTGPLVLLESLPYQLPGIRDKRSGYGNRAQCLPVYLRNAAAEMKRLHELKEAYRVFDPKTGSVKGHRLKFSDMCVLVRGRTEAAAAKAALTAAEVPYSEYKEKGLFKTLEAESVQAWLEFLSNPGGRGRLAALLMTPFFGVTPSRLPGRLEEYDAAFSRLVDRWQELVLARNWNRLFESLMDDTHLSLLLENDFDFDRRWASTRQILDRLLTEVGSTACSVDEFSTVLRRLRAEDAEALRNRERTGDCVQILTMHASKGLEFKVVFMPFGFGNIKRDDYDEEKRLVYVAITRAEQKLYLPWTRWAQHQCGRNTEIGIGGRRSPLLDTGCLAQAILRCIDEGLVRKEGAGFIHHVPHAAGKKGDEEFSIPVCYRSCEPSAELEDWQRLPYLRDRRLHWDSFSSLNDHEGAPAIPVPDEAGENDERESTGGATPAAQESLLPKGALSGTVFHEIMEDLCRNGDDGDSLGFKTVGHVSLATLLAPKGALMKLVHDVMAKHALEDRASEGDSTARTLVRMAYHALNTPIALGDRTFYLRDVDRENRRAEIRFVVDESVLLNQPSAGVVNGSIDLLVRPDGVSGPVYILDWKTNSLPDYDEASLKDAMDAAGYHLQYQIYSLAVRQWLGEGKLGGIAYLFVRGGASSDGLSGVFAQAADGDWDTNCRQALDGVLMGKGR